MSLVHVHMSLSPVPKNFLGQLLITSTVGSLAAEAEQEEIGFALSAWTV